LRSFAKLDEKRNLRFKDKEEKETNELSVDVQTRLILLKWINSSEIDRVEGMINRFFLFFTGFPIRRIYNCSEKL